MGDLLEDPGSIGQPSGRSKPAGARIDWRPDELGGCQPPPPVERATHVRYEVALPAATKAYVLLQFALATLGTVAFLDAGPRRPVLARAAAGLAVLVSLVSLGGLLDRRRWAVPLEALRLTALALGAGAWLRPGPAASAALLLAAVSLAGLRRAAARQSSSRRSEPASPDPNTRVKIASTWVR